MATYAFSCDLALDQEYCLVVHTDMGVTFKRKGKYIGEAEGFTCLVPQFLDANGDTFTHTMPRKGLVVADSMAEALLEAKRQKQTTIRKLQSGINHIDQHLRKEGIMRLCSNYFLLHTSFRFSFVI